MTSERSVTRRERFELAGDGALITAALLAVLISITLLIAGGVGNREVPPAIQVLSGVTVLLGGIAGPVIAWRMHQRRISALAIAGAFLGGFVAGGAFWLFVALSAVLGWVLSPFTKVEYAGPLAAAALVAAAFVALMVWIAVDAVRDYARATREHGRLDIARIASALIVVAFSAAIVVLAVRTGGEIGEAIAFMLVAAVSGGLMVLMADIVSTPKAPRTEPAPASE